ncbi:MAG: hypothetical protein Q8P41_22335 [Pseudomonadota bacterium]|nr:hypothetical protein [Pseudomonadota bacterium]
MDLKLTFLGRAAGRWRVRVDMPPEFRPSGLTVGLWGEDDKPLGPAVVAPAGIDGVWEAELAGPVTLPPGTLVRCMADMEDGTPVVYWLGVDRRRGLHAFLHADGRLPVESDSSCAALAAKEIVRLARAFPWVRPDPPPPTAPCGARRTVAEALAAELGEDTLSPELRDLLKDEFGVDVDAEEEEDDILDFIKS